MRPIEKLKQRELVVPVLSAGALIFAGVSAYYLYRSVAAPHELYDNERGLLALLSSIPAFLLAIGSLFSARSARSLRFTIARIVAVIVAIYALMVAVR